MHPPMTPATMSPTTPRRVFYSPRREHRYPSTPDPKRRRFNGEVWVPPRNEVIPGPYTHTPRLPPLKIDQRGGVEAMIMTIPVLNKVKILSQAAPPLAAPGPASQPHEIRGAIIAVEGKADAMMQYLTEELSKSFAVRVFNGPELKGGSIESFLQTIGNWHQTSREMTKFITTRDDSNPPTLDLIPIAIVPCYQLTTVDVSAISMPITDSYSPLDHWRWLAALWRGCVGPDVTIVVQGVDEEGVAPGVDVRLVDARTVVVRLAKGEEVDEKALRRVGFEVEELLRK